MRCNHCHFQRLVEFSYKKRGVRGTIKKELRRRDLVEPAIGHLKTDSLLGRSYLKGEWGDKQNALLSAAAYNFKLLQRWLKRFYLRLKQLGLVFK